MHRLALTSASLLALTLTGCASTPVLKLFGFPALVEGGTEVVLEGRSICAADGVVEADFKFHWQHGGAWMIKGVGTLEQDIGSALRAALNPLLM